MPSTSGDGRSPAGTVGTRKLARRVEDRLPPDPIKELPGRCQILKHLSKFVVGALAEASSVGYHPSGVKSEFRRGNNNPIVPNHGAHRVRHRPVPALFLPVAPQLLQVLEGIVTHCVQRNPIGIFGVDLLDAPQLGAADASTPLKKEYQRRLVLIQKVGRRDNATIPEA